MMKRKVISVILLMVLVVSGLLTNRTVWQVQAANRVLKEGSIGMDVSSHQYVDWDTIKKDNYIKFAILRCGYGDDDVEQDDSQFQRNVAECKRLNIPFGVYLYSYAVNEKEALSEANHIKRMIGDSKPQMGVYLDVEDTAYYIKHGLNVYTDEGRRRLTDLVKIVLNNLSDTGWRTGIYSSYNYYANILYADELSAYRWIASWPDLDNPDKVLEAENKVRQMKGVLWQYRSDGRVHGVYNANHQPGNVDLDELLIDWVLESDEADTKPGGSNSQECVPGALGDVNNDGFINISDAVILKKYLAGYSDIHINVKAANVNKDYDEEQKDLISVGDVIIILKHLAGLDTIKLGEVIPE